MAYLALEKMRQANEKKYGRDIGPMQPVLPAGAAEDFDLKSSVLRFLHERCENLLFDRRLEEEEERTGACFGTGSAPNQIPYNMEMDINRLCLERELEKFLDSGATQDAYNVFYCFLEMFFGSYGRSKKMVELLSEYESNGSSMLMKHRDHYVHSVYVFVLGLAIYETNDRFRAAFDRFYGFASEEGRSQEAANFFLEFWGVTALFHDIGYPFELTFEQVLSFFDTDDDERGKATPYIIYSNIESMTKLSPRAQDAFEKMYGKRFATIDELMAFDLAKKLGEAYGVSEEELLGVLQKKPVSPGSFCYYMDHAYFSTLCLYRQLEAAKGLGEEDVPHTFCQGHVDALGAILLHYDLFTYSILSDEKPRLSMDLHPLAWLLMLCDELQCWDRTAYGRNSRSELHPMAVEFDFRDSKIVARYLYDKEEQDKIDAYLWAFVAWKKGGKIGKAPRLKAYSDMADERKSFVRDIEAIVDISEVALTVVCDTAQVNRGNKQVYLSSSSFLHLHDFAVALNARYAHAGDWEKVDQATMEQEFSKLSLEYKLTNINQVRNFSRHLNAIRCFYTDQPVDFDMVEAFTPEQLECLALLENERWVRERRAMGWRCGDLYEQAEVPDGADEKAYRAMLREQMRCHKYAMDGELDLEQIREHYHTALPEEEKDKDRQPFNSLPKLLRKFDGLRIYRFGEAAGND